MARVDKKDYLGRVKPNGRCKTRPRHQAAAETGVASVPGPTRKASLCHDFAHDRVTTRTRTRYRHTTAPGRNGSESCCSSTCVDDGALVEPDAGKRCYRLALRYVEGVVAVLGQGATNETKKAEEGERWTQATGWGPPLLDT